MPRATPGNAGLDLANAKDMILSKWDGVTPVPTLIIGQILPQTVELVIGHSSNYKKNFKVLPGIIHSDTKKWHKNTIRPLSETIQIHKGQRIAQLILLPYVNLPNPILKQDRGMGQFGSSDVMAWVQDIHE